MKSVLNVIITMAFLASTGIASAQFRKIPAEVTEAFKDKYPDTKNAEWKDKLSVFTVNFEMNDAKYVSKFNANGEWQQTEKEIEEADLPMDLKDGFEKSKYSNWEIKQVGEIENKEGTIQYRLLVKKNNVEKKWLLFNSEGKLLKEMITL
jgi:hypothetical protein